MVRLLSAGAACVALSAALLVAFPSLGGAAPVGSPFSLQAGGAAGGYPLGGSGPKGVQIRFIDHASFQLGVLLKNRSKQQVTIVGVQTPEPINSLARQTRSAFTHYTPCKGPMMCPWLDDPRHPSSPKPLAVAPGHDVGVTLDYRLVSCLREKAGTTATGNSLVVSYRLAGHRSIEQQSFPIGASKLLLERPVGEACVPRPYSYIGLVGSFTTSPEHQPFPGSDGDTCTLSVARGLAFTSRQFFSRDQTLFRVEIRLPQYHGPGAYGSAAGGGRPLGPAKITVIGAFGLTSHTTFVDTHGEVSVTNAKPPLYGGRFRAVLSGHRRFFRAYGSWRCTTNYR